MANFSNAKVGDKVYHLDYGYCTIYDINDFKMYVFDYNDDKYGIKKDSKCIYHSKPEIIEAKRMVKKEIDVFLNVYTAEYKTIIDIKNGYVTPAKLTFEVEE